MTAQEIRDSLKPFKDFVTAVWKAAEIVEAAEQAEATLKKGRQAHKELQQQTEDAQTTLAKVQASVAKARQQLGGLNADLDTRKAKAEAELAKVKEAHDAAHASHAEVCKAHEDTLADLRKQIDEQRKKYDVATKALEDLKKGIHV